MIYVPTLIVSEGYVGVNEGRFRTGRYPLDCIDPDTLQLLQETDALHPAGPDPSRVERARQRADRFLEMGSRNLVRLQRAGVAIAMGTDAGNPLTPHGPSVYAEMEAMQEAGLTPMEVLVAATANGARAMGRGEDLGTVEAGKIADLLVLEADPSGGVENLRRLRMVIRAGVVHERSELLPLQDARP